MAELIYNMENIMEFFVASITRARPYKFVSKFLVTFF